MPTPGILESLSAAWATEVAPGKKLLDLSCGLGFTSEMLATWFPGDRYGVYRAPAAIEWNRPCGRRRSQLFFAVSVVDF